MATRRVRPAQAQLRPRPATAGTAEPLRANVETHGRTTVIHLVGSVCCATAPALREAVHAVLAERPVTVVLDLAEVTADDELGLWVLPAMAGDAAQREIALLIAAPTRALRVRLRRLGGHHLEITDTLPAIAQSPLGKQPREPLTNLDPAGPGQARSGRP
jgi:anti-anti-sigma regulatory factor